MAGANWNTELAALMKEKSVTMKDVFPKFHHRATPYKHLAGTRRMDLRSAQAWADVLGMGLEEFLDRIKPDFEAFDEMKAANG